MNLPDDFARRGMTFATCTNAHTLASDPLMVGHLLENFGMVYPEVGAFLDRFLADPQPVYDLAAFAHINGLKFAIMPGLVWNYSYPHAAFASLSRKAILDVLRAVIADLARFQPTFLSVANEMVMWSGALRAGPWVDVLGPTILEDVYRIARECAPRTPLAYNDFVINDRHAKRVAKLYRQGINLALIQGHSPQNGRLYGKYSPDNIDAIIARYKYARLGVGFSEVDVEYSEFEPSPAASTWGSLVCCARRNRMQLFGLWGANDSHNWKQPMRPTPWGVQGANRYAPKPPVMTAITAALA